MASVYRDVMKDVCNHTNADLSYYKNKNLKKRIYENKIVSVPWRLNGRASRALRILNSALIGENNVQLHALADLSW